MQGQGTSGGQFSHSDRRARQVLYRLHRDFGIKDLASEAQIPIWKAGRALHRLEKAGDVEWVSRGVWRTVREEAA